MPRIRCIKCGDMFYAKPSHIKMGWAKFCSRKCHYESMGKKKKFSCEICGKEIFRSDSKISHSKSQKFFCSKSCQTKWRNRFFSGLKHKLWKGGRNTYQRVMLQSGKPKICQMCAEKDVRVMAIHHIDENKLNNNSENLVWLCHNCHYLVHHDKVEKRKFLVEANH